MASTRDSPPTWNAATRRDRAGTAALVVPALIGVLLFFVGPAAALVWLSTRVWDIVGPAEEAGLENFAAVVSDPGFVHALGVTAIIAAVALPLEIVSGLVLAVLVVEAPPGTRAWRGVIVLPWLIAPFVAGTLWQWILSPSSGWISMLTGHRFDGLTDPATAPLIVGLVIAWSEAGYVALFFIAGLLTVPRSQVEAARVDGARTISTLWHVQLPQLRPILLFVVVTGVIRMLGVYDQIVALTGGGPGTATRTTALWIYDAAFGAFDIGRAASAALLLVGVTLVGLAAIGERRRESER